MKDEIRRTHMHPETQRTLVRTKRRSKKNEFADAVIESFTIEYGKVSQARIADLVGWASASRVNQVITSPSSLDTGTIQTLISPLKSKSNKRRIIQAWAIVVFGQDYTDTYFAGRIPDSPTKESLRVADRLLMEGRPVEAASVCLEIHQNSLDPDLKEAADTRHFYARIHAHEIGWAMLIAGSMIAEGKLSKRPRREAYGHLQSVRVLLELPTVDRAAIEERLAIAQSLLAISPDKNLPVEGQANELDCFELRCRMILRLAELDHQVPLAEITEMRDILLKASKLKLKDPWDFWIPLLAARASLLLGERVLATDLLERARKLDAGKVYHADPEIGLVHADIICSSGKRAELYEYLREQSWRCYERGDSLNRLKFEQRIAQYFKDMT